MTTCTYSAWQRKIKVLIQKMTPILMVIKFFNVYICLIYLLSMQVLIFVVENTSAKPFMY